MPLISYLSIHKIQLHPACSFAMIRTLKFIVKVVSFVDSIILYDLLTLASRREHDTYNSCNMCTRGLPDMHPQLQDSGVHIRQTTHAHVTIVTYTANTTMHTKLQIL